jgi:hypothetical protein
VEHHPAGQQHGAERQGDREEAERGELHPYSRQPPQCDGAEDADGKRRGCNGEREQDQGRNL